MKTSHYLVCYDIKQDDIRTSISNICKDFGLNRIQYSVFFGTLTYSHLKELQIKHKTIIKNSDANIQYFHICQSCLNKHQILFSVDPNSTSEDDESKEEEMEYNYNEGIVFH